MIKNKELFIEHLARAKGALEHLVLIELAWAAPTPSAAFKVALKAGWGYRLALACRELTVVKRVWGNTDFPFIAETFCESLKFHFEGLCFCSCHQCKKCFSMHEHGRNQDIKKDCFCSCHNCKCCIRQRCYCSCHEFDDDRTADHAGNRWHKKEGTFYCEKCYFCYRPHYQHDNFEWNHDGSKNYQRDEDYWEDDQYYDEDDEYDQEDDYYDENEYDDYDDYDDDDEETEDELSQQQDKAEPDEQETDDNAETQEMSDEKTTEDEPEEEPEVEDREADDVEGEDHEALVESEPEAVEEPRDPKERLDEVASNIQKVVGDVDYEMVDSDGIFANVNKDGKIKVSKGLVEDADDDELAGVVIHEVKHHEKKHIEKHTEKIKKSLEDVDEYASTIKGGFVKRAVLKTLIYSTGIASTVVNSRSLSQQHEKEADAEIPEVAKKAGYDPDGFERFIEKHGHDSQGFWRDLVSTHPTRRERVDNIKRNKK